MALLCEYEQERLRNIARNQARMQQLLGGLPLKAPPPALAAKQHEKQNPSSKKKLPVKRKTTEDGAAEGAEASHWVRRSTRNIPPPPSLQASAGTHNASATTRDLPPPPPADAFVSVDTWRRTHGSSHGGKSASAAVKADTAAGTSTKELVASVEELCSTFLGRRVDRACRADDDDDDDKPPLPPKAHASACVFAPAAMAKQPDNPHAYVPRFNKYSGVQEWSNAVALYVNAVPKDEESVHTCLASSASSTYGGYHNLFARQGRRMRWYAPKGQDEDSPVVRRLIGSGEGDGSTRVLLFLRRETEPYVFCGRVSCTSVLPGSAPVQLEWTLLDFDVLRLQDDYVRLMGAEMVRDDDDDDDDDDALLLLLLRTCKRGGGGGRGPPWR
ncbi:hypothetical protein NFJ02_09g142910 [Pycnococcus provasolii]